MKTIGATEFKAKCLHIMDELPAEGVVITKHGRPVARLVRYETATFGDFIGALAGRIAVHGDILSAEREWDAAQGVWEPPESEDAAR